MYCLTWVFGLHSYRMLRALSLLAKLTVSFESCCLMSEPFCAVCWQVRHLRFERHLSNIEWYCNHNPKIKVCLTNTAGANKSGVGVRSCSQVLCMHKVHCKWPMQKLIFHCETELSWYCCGTGSESLLWQGTSPCRKPASSLGPCQKWSQQWLVGPGEKRVAENRDQIMLQVNVQATGETHAFAMWNTSFSGCVRPQLLVGYCWIL